jgi:hypothetical protein
MSRTENGGGMRGVQRAVLIAVLACHSAPTVAQARRDTLRANSRAMRISDGHSTTDWWVEPGPQPDTYHTAFPLMGGTVTFVSDLDSLTLAVKPGEVRDFIVRLHDSVSVVTRISAVSTFARPRILAGDSMATQTIPFTIRRNRIYIEGSINGSAPLQIQFDLGTTGSVYNAQSLGRAPITWDESDVLHNSDGRNAVPASRQNTIRIGNMEWRGQRLVQARNMERYEDLIVGNSLFRDRIVEIDYDRSQLRVHAVSAPGTTGFMRQSLALHLNVIPLIEAELLVDGTRIKQWYMFDTGHSGPLLLSARQNREHQLASRLGAWFGFGGRKTFRARGFRIGGLEMPAATAVVETYSDVNRGKSHGLLGNAWLRHFNVILDNRQGAIWLAPTRDARAATASR